MEIVLTKRQVSTAIDALDLYSRIFIGQYDHLNWDIRLYSGSNETVSNDKVGLAKSSDANPVTLWWMELPDGFVAMD